MHIFNENHISLKFVSKGPIDNSSAMVQVMAPSHYLNQWWQRPMMSFITTRLQWTKACNNMSWINPYITQWELWSDSLVVNSHIFFITKTRVFPVDCTLNAQSAAEMCGMLLVVNNWCVIYSLFDKNISIEISEWWVPCIICWRKHHLNGNVFQLMTFSSQLNQENADVNSAIKAIYFQIFSKT